MSRAAVVASAWGPVVAWMALIFGVSHIPSLQTGWGLWDLILRKAAHMFEFGVLTLFCVRAALMTTSFRGGRALGAAGAFALLYAISDEWHQSFVPGRGPSAADVVIDGLGILAAAILVWRTGWIGRFADGEQRH